jgi:hypothetical protein
MNHVCRRRDRLVLCTFPPTINTALSVDIIIIFDIRFTPNQPSEISNPEIMKVCNEMTLESSVVVD